MNKYRIMKDNRGASLVMVLLAMMFVGIIAAIALAITVGNSKSSKATMDTSKNFYSTESILDDLEMYLKKLATNAATEAYASSLTKLGTGIDVEGDFESTFATKIYDLLRGDGTNGIITGNVGADRSFNLDLLQDICYDRYGITSNSSEYTDPTKIPIKITYDNIENTGGYTKIKGLTITLIENGFESTITTDITFKAKMPSSSSVDSAGEFSYGIDHYVIISGNNISSHSSVAKITGTYTGNIYAQNDIIVQSGSGASSGSGVTNSLRFNSQYIVAGNDILVDNVVAGEKGQLSVSSVNNSKIIPSSGDAKLFADDIKIFDGAFSGTNLSTYLRGNLEINGDTGSFAAAGDDFYGYSANSGTETYKLVTATGEAKQYVDAVKPKSSAIILNGLGAKLDLSSIGTVKLMGTAYTSMSDLKGVSDSYSSYNSQVSSNLYYFTQGESITYRALQALYLVPGNRIDGVGHNPMSVSEYEAALVDGSLSIDTTNIPGLKSTVYKKQLIRHIPGSGSGTSTEGQYYIFWDFENVSDAVDYFTTIIDSDLDSLEFSGHDLSASKIKMLYDKSGYIRLPSAGSGVQTKGNAVYYADNELKTKGGGTSGDMSSYANRYANLKGSASDLTTAPTNNKSLLENIFPKVNDGSGEKKWLETILEPGQKTYPLRGPLDTYTDSNGNIITSTLHNEESAYDLMLKRQKYVLVTGKTGINWTESFDTDTTYIFVSGGDVKIDRTSATPVRAMIIAEGNVYLPNGLSLECLGMLDYKTEKTTGGYELIKDYDEDLTEFKALLGVCVTGDSEYILDEHGNATTTVNGNTKFRRIFNLANTSGSGGSGNGNDFVTIETSEWKRN